MENEKEPSMFESIRMAHRQVKEYINNSWLGKSLEWLGNNFGAFYRQGAKEFAQILPAFPDSVRPVEELGWGNPTQWEVNEERGNVYGKDGVQAERPATGMPAKPFFERDPGYEEWCDQQAAMQPPSQEMGREM
jgi:hypothetical protein